MYVNSKEVLSVEILPVPLDQEMEERRLLGGKLNVAGRHSDPLVDVRHVEQTVHCCCQGQVALDLGLADKYQFVEVRHGGDIHFGHFQRHHNHVL